MCCGIIIYSSVMSYIVHNEVLLILNYSVQDMYYSFKHVSMFDLQYCLL